MREDAWTDYELQLLYDYVNDELYLKKVADLLPNRTLGTIKNRMARLRAEAGIRIKASSYGLESDPGYAKAVRELVDEAASEGAKKGNYILDSRNALG